MKFWQIATILFILVIPLTFVFQAYRFTSQFRQISKMRLGSSVFKTGQSIPTRFSCRGENISPPLFIYNVPQEAVSLALIMEDADTQGGPWYHWVVWNIHPKTVAILENTIPAKAVVGTNGAGGNRYQGPCPPSGTHRYFFKLYALDIDMNMPAGSSGMEIKRAMDGHVLGETYLGGVSP